MKRGIMQRICALGLCAALTLPVFAAETPKEEEKPDPTRVSWSELGERVRNGNLTALAMAQNIGRINAIDYQKMEDELRDNLNEIANTQWMMTAGASMSAGSGSESGSGTPSLPPSAGEMAAISIATAAAQMSSSMAAQSLQSTYNALKDRFDDVHKGKMKQDNDDIVRGIEDGVNQLVAGSESLYLGILQLQDARKGAERGLATLDRSLTELRLRQKLGQVSCQTVESLEQTRDTVVSQIDQLDDNIKSCKINLQLMMGEEPNGILEVAAVTIPTEAELDAMDPEAGLESAKEASYSLMSAKRTLDDAKKEWNDASQYGYKGAMAEHAWKAAQLTYDGQVQSFENAFNTLCRTVETDRKAVQAKYQAAAYAQSRLATAQNKLSRGLISKNKMLESQDALDTAQSELEGAKLQLFTDYNAYRNAVEYGILSQGG